MINIFIILARVVKLRERVGFAACRRPTRNFSCHGGTLKVQRVSRSSCRPGFCAEWRCMNSLSFSKYLSEIGAIPLLTRQREAELGCIVQTGLRCQATDAEKSAAEEAQRELVQRNLKLVVAMAKRFLGCGLPLDEITSDGNAGLIEAARRYNPVFKTRFSTYATWWIQQFIRQGIHRSHTIRVPDRRLALLHKIVNSRSFNDSVGPQDLEKLEIETGIPWQKIDALLSHRVTVVSLNTPQCNGDETLETAIDSGEESPVNGLITDEETRFVCLVLSDLSQHERHIVCRRFGIGDGKIETLDNLAAVYGVSRERIRQIEKSAVKKMHLKLKPLLRPEIQNGHPFRGQRLTINANRFGIHWSKSQRTTPHC